MLKIQRHTGKIDGNLQLANTYIELGSELFRIKKYKKATKAYRIAVVIRKGVFGEQHILVSEAQRGRGLALWKLGKRKRAIDTLSGVLDQLEKHLGCDHSDVAQVIHWLADLHCPCKKRPCSSSCPNGCDPSASLTYLDRLLGIQLRSLVDDGEVRRTKEEIANMHTFAARRHVECGENDDAVESYQNTLRLYIELKLPADALVAYLALSVLTNRGHE